MPAMPSWVWFLIVLFVIFAVIVFVGGSCTLGDHSINAR